MLLEAAASGSPGLGCGRWRRGSLYCEDAARAAAALPHRLGVEVSISAASVAISRITGPSRRHLALLERARARRFGENHVFGYVRGESRRVMIRKASSGAARDEGVRRTPPEDEAREQRGTKHPRFGDQSRHPRRRPAIERRRLCGEWRWVSCERRKARQGGDTGRAVDDDVVGEQRMLGRLATERVARYPGEAQALLALVNVLFGRIQRRALRIGLGQRDAPSLRAAVSCEVWCERFLAGAAALIAQGDDHRSPPNVERWAICPRTAESLDSLLDSKLGETQATEIASEKAASCS